MPSIDGMRVKTRQLRTQKKAHLMCVIDGQKGPSWSDIVTCQDIKACWGLVRR